MQNALLHVRRLKNGLPSTHPIRGPELRALRILKRDYPDTPYIFVTERRGPLTPDAVQKIVRRAGDLAVVFRKVGNCCEELVRLSRDSLAEA